LAACPLGGFPDVSRRPGCDDAGVTVHAPRIAIVAHGSERTSEELAHAWRALGLDAVVLDPDRAVRELRRGDVALFRLDVLPSVDGFEPGLGCVPDLRSVGVRILNPPWAVLGAHDKLETARRLLAARLPHPRTTCVRHPLAPVDLEPPVVVKPRYGSWGVDVFRCDTERDLRACLHAVAGRTWFTRHGALVQELVSPPPRDLRLIVAGGRVVGAAAREAQEGEWRSNVSLGARLVPAVPGPDATHLGLAAVAAVGGDLVGVDLLPLDDGGFIVLELNGAAEFDERYSQPGTDVFVEAARALGLDTEHDRTRGANPGADASAVALATSNLCR
jgi:RimK family alpha-L-glutamate ligase